MNKGLRMMARLWGATVALSSANKDIIVAYMHGDSAVPLTLRGSPRLASLDRAELILAHAAFRTDPVGGQFVERRAGLDSMLGIADLGIVHVPARIAHVLLHGKLQLGVSGFDFGAQALNWKGLEADSSAGA